jgi:hypothetical protein
MDQLWEHKDTKQTSKFTTIKQNYFHKCQSVYIHRLLFKIGNLLYLPSIILSCLQYAVPPYVLSTRYCVVSNSTFLGKANTVMTALQHVCPLENKAYTADSAYFRN